MATKFTTLDNKQSKKETIFTHLVGTDKKPIDVSEKASQWENVLHLGRDTHYGDVFKAWENEDEDGFCIFFGVKGNEHYL